MTLNCRRISSTSVSVHEPRKHDVKVVGGITFPEEVLSGLDLSMCTQLLEDRDLRSVKGWDREVLSHVRAKSQARVSRCRRPEDAFDRLVELGVEVCVILVNGQTLHKGA